MVFVFPIALCRDAATCLKVQLTVVLVDEPNHHRAIQFAVIPSPHHACIEVAMVVFGLSNNLNGFLFGAPVIEPAAIAKK